MSHSKSLALLSAGLLSLSTTVCEAGPRSGAIADAARQAAARDVARLRAMPNHNVAANRMPLANPPEAASVKPRDLSRDFYGAREGGHPRNQGFADGEGAMRTLPEGTVVTRRGSSDGTFVGLDPNAKPENLSLIPKVEAAPPRHYRTLSEMRVPAGEVRPGYGRPGGGQQAVMPAPISDITVTQMNKNPNGLLKQTTVPNFGNAANPKP